MKNFFMALITVALSILMTLVLAEIGLRFLPVHDYPPRAGGRADDPILRFHSKRDFTYSQGWDFAIVNQVHTNNDGWVNDQDYAPADPRPLVAAIGDSYVEALMVPWTDTFHGRLAKTLGTRGRVYSFGVSGAPLSQYLAFAEYAVRGYHPAGLVIPIIGNDFDESLDAYAQYPGQHHFHRNADGSLSLKLFDRPRGGLRAFASNSALVRYLALNVHANEQIQGIARRLITSPGKGAGETFAGNTSADASSGRVADGDAAIAEFFKELATRTGLPPDRILFVVDGPRTPAEAEAIKGSFYDLERQHFMAAAAGLGYEAIDLSPRFLAASAVDPKWRADFPTDAHWSAQGHAVVAETIAQSAFYRRVFEASR